MYWLLTAGYIMCRPIVSYDDVPLIWLNIAVSYKSRNYIACVCILGSPGGHAINGYHMWYNNTYLELKYNNCNVYTLCSLQYSL